MYVNDAVICEGRHTWRFTRAQLNRELEVEYTEPIIYYLIRQWIHYFLSAVWRMLENVHLSSLPSTPAPAAFSCLLSRQGTVHFKGWLSHSASDNHTGLLLIHWPQPRIQIALTVTWYAISRRQLLPPQRRLWFGFRLLAGGGKI